MESAVKKLKQSLRSGWSGKMKQKDIQEERWFLENGSIFLQKLIADCNGKSIPIRSFSSEQILEATNNFDLTCFVSEDAHYKWYRGKIEDRSYMTKRFSEGKFTNYRIGEIYSYREVYKDIVLSARMSNHNNFLKLLGCCLEFPFPVLLFEDAEYGVLNHRGGVMVNGKESLLPLSLRLRIGKEIANAVTYLHMAFPQIIIHRDVQPMHVFLDKNWTAKLSSFLFSISLPEGKTRIETRMVLGTRWYIDPSYYTTYFVTEYTDVYSFGICLLVFLTSRPAVIISDGDDQLILDYVRSLLYENGRLDELIDPMVMEDITSAQRMQVEACLALALSCCEKSDEDRPKMIQVAKELKRIQALC